MVEHWIIDPAVRVQFPPKSWEFFCLNCYALFFVTDVIRKMGACPGLDLIPRRNGLILHRNDFQVIINDDFMMTSLKRGGGGGGGGGGGVTTDNSTLRIAYTCRFIPNF